MLLQRSTRFWGRMRSPMYWTVLGLFLLNILYKILWLQDSPSEDYKYSKIYSLLELIELEFYITRKSSSRNSSSAWHFLIQIIHVSGATIAYFFYSSNANHFGRRWHWAILAIVSSLQVLEFFHVYRQGNMPIYLLAKHAFGINNFPV